MPSAITVTIDYASPEWEAVPANQRSRVRDLAVLLSSAPETGVVAWLRAQALQTGISYQTLSRKYYALRNAGGDWTALIDRRATTTLSPASDALCRQPHFVAHLVQLAASHQRKNLPAIRQLHRTWAARRLPIPGYEDWPGWPTMPSGWSTRNLSQIINQATNDARLRSLRVSTSSKSNPFLPTVLTTRVGLWPQAVIQIDDVWHDHHVTWGARRETVRVLELGALDLYSAHRYHWGARPRRKKDGGGHESINSADARMFIAGLLHAHGYSERGTVIMAEHGTAAISEDVERILYDATGGRLRVTRQPIEGRQAALTGYWSGSEGGNFRAKAALESIHNRIHNDLAMLPMQAGSPSSGLPAPVTTDRQLAYIDRILREVIKHAPHRIDLLRLPTWDFHKDFIPFLTDYYHFGLASRTDHDLEGWATLGHYVTEWATVPGSGLYMDEPTFLALPEVSQLAIREAARRDPAAWSRRRALSPLEVWRTRPRPATIPPTAIADILGRDLARDVTCRRGYLEFSDQSIAPDPLIYQARYSSGPLTGREIHHGEKVAMFAMPFDDSTALVVDAAGRYLGEVPLYKRVTPIDSAALLAAAPWDTRPDVRSHALTAAAGDKHQRIADILEPDRLSHAADVAAAAALREHNRAVVTGAPVTPEERAAARSASAQQGQRTAAAHRLQGRGNAVDWDAITPATPADPWGDLPDTYHTPDAL